MHIFLWKNNIVYKFIFLIELCTYSYKFFSERLSYSEMYSFKENLFSEQSHEECDPAFQEDWAILNVRLALGSDFSYIGIQPLWRYDFIHSDNFCKKY